MLGPRNDRVSSVHGRIEMEEASAEKQTNILQMVRTRFTYVYVFLAILLLLALAGVVISLMLLTNMKKGEQRMRNISAAGSERFMRLYEEVSSLKGTRRNPTALSDVISKLSPEQITQARAFGLLPKDTVQTSSPSPDMGEPIKPISINSVGSQNDLIQMSLDEFPEKVNVVKNDKNFYAHSWHDSSCAIKCNKPDVTIPPLLVISLDGFSREYLDRNLVPSLQSLATCGAKAKYIYPSFPSKTFPNHYTMMTGLYPEAHGITDNYIYDPSISPDVVDVRQSKNGAYFGGEPIWSAAVRQRRRMFCLFWPGCSFNITGYNPTKDIPYNRSLPYSTRVDMIVDWLTLPANQRPDMIAAYFDQPDQIGHFHRTDEEVNLELNYIESVLNYLFTSLQKHDLIDCTNIVVVSDHGMQSLNKRIYLNEQLDITGAITVNGVIGQIHVGNSSHSSEDFLEKLSCHDTKHIHVYDRKRVPTRYHYSKSNRIGDVLLEGQPGTIVWASKKDDYHVMSDHGYDYIEKSMHAIFFARGPNIRPKVEVNPFQNIELFNFFAELLRLNNDVPNNGTDGLLSNLLYNIKSIRSNEPDNLRPVQECALIAPLQTRQVKSCAQTKKCEEEANEANQQLDSCPLQTSPDGVFYTNQQHICYINLCSIFTMVNPLVAYGTSTLVYEVITSEQSQTAKDPESKDDYCAFNDLRYEPSCANWTATVEQNHEKSFKWHSILGNDNNELKHYSRLQFLMHENFISGPFAYLQNITRHYAEKYSRIVSITGAVYDFDMNGLADEPDVFWRHISALPSEVGHEERAPSHLTRLLIRCEENSWHINGVTCKRQEATRILAFVLPNSDRELNCLHPLDYLRKNMARVRDLELLSNVQLFHERMWFPSAESIRWRQNITEELWPL
ncbi:Ectonucleotide pyrophosphatase/phosphodiesterase C27A7.1 [Aphelenchoides besseyi]|nr:Ectonucleotide pyrophosphatase/phosphodiesterase C27A7.1 [Aphelenchoides besseyi]